MEDGVGIQRQVQQEIAIDHLDDIAHHIAQDQYQGKVADGVLSKSLLKIAHLIHSLCRIALGPCE